MKERKKKEEKQRVLSVECYAIQVMIIVETVSVTHETTV